MNELESRLSAMYDAHEKLSSMYNEQLLLATVAKSTIARQHEMYNQVLRNLHKAETDLEYYQKLARDHTRACGGCDTCYRPEDEDEDTNVNVCDC